MAKEGKGLGGLLGAQSLQEPLEEVKGGQDELKA